MTDNLVASRATIGLNNVVNDRPKGSVANQKPSFLSKVLDKFGGYTARSYVVNQQLREANRNVGNALAV